MRIWDFIMRRKAFLLPLAAAFVIGGLLGSQLPSKVTLLTDDLNPTPEALPENLDYQPAPQKPETIHVAIVEPDEVSGESDGQFSSTNPDEEVDIPLTGADLDNTPDRMVDQFLGEVTASYLDSAQKQAAAASFSLWQSIVVKVVGIISAGILVIVLVRAYFLRKIYK